MADFDRRTWAFNLVLVSGVLFIFRGIRNVVESQDIATVSPFMGGVFDGIGERFLVMGIFGLIGGAFLVFAALRMRSHPGEMRSWGIASVIAAGATYLLATGLLGAVAGIAGGVLGIAAQEPAGPDDSGVRFS